MIRHPLILTTFAALIVALSVSVGCDRGGSSAGSGSPATAAQRGRAARKFDHQMAALEARADQDPKAPSSVALKQGCAVARQPVLDNGQLETAAGTAVAAQPASAPDPAAKGPAADPNALAATELVLGATARSAKASLDTGMTARQPAAAAAAIGGSPLAKRQPALAEGAQALQDVANAATDARRTPEQIRDVIVNASRKLEEAGDRVDSAALAAGVQAARDEVAAGNKAFADLANGPQVRAAKEAADRVAAAAQRLKAAGPADQAQAVNEFVGAAADAQEKIAAVMGVEGVDAESALAAMEPAIGVVQSALSVASTIANWSDMNDRQRVGAVLKDMGEVMMAAQPFLTAAAAEVKLPLLGLVMILSQFINGPDLGLGGGGGGGGGDGDSGKGKGEAKAPGNNGDPGKGEAKAGGSGPAENRDGDGAAGKNDVPAPRGEVPAPAPSGSKADPAGPAASAVNHSLKTQRGQGPDAVRRSVEKELSKVPPDRGGIDSAPARRAIADGAAKVAEKDGPHDGAAVNRMIDNAVKAADAAARAAEKTYPRPPDGTEESDEVKQKRRDLADSLFSQALDAVRQAKATEQIVTALAPGGPAAEAKDGRAK